MPLDANSRSPWCATARSSISSRRPSSSLSTSEATNSRVTASNIGLARAVAATYPERVTSTAERLREASAKADSALAAVRADQGASPVLISVVNEFAKKAEKAVHSEDERTAVIEFEQAGDSAKAAVEA